jgi:hypothetical protein
MDKCAKCGAETQLYESGNPICVKCSEEIDAARKQIARDKMEHGKIEQRQPASKLARTAYH